MCSQTLKENILKQAYVSKTFSDYVVFRGNYQVSIPNSRMPQLHLYHRVARRTIIMDELCHPHVPPGESPGVMEGGYPPDLACF